MGPGKGPPRLLCRDPMGGTYELRQLLAICEARQGFREAIGLRAGCWKDTGRLAHGRRCRAAGWMTASWSVVAGSGRRLGAAVWFIRSGGDRL